MDKETLIGAGIHENDLLNVTFSKGSITLSKTVKRMTLEERAALYDNKLNLDGEIDWGTPQGREIL